MEADGKKEEDEKGPEKVALGVKVKSGAVSEGEAEGDSLWNCVEDAAGETLDTPVPVGGAENKEEGENLLVAESEAASEAE
jgi:hypothetical protein